MKYTRLTGEYSAWCLGDCILFLLCRLICLPKWNVNNLCLSYCLLTIVKWKVVCLSTRYVIILLSSFFIFIRVHCRWIWYWCFFLWAVKLLYMIKSIVIFFKQTVWTTKQVRRWMQRNIFNFTLLIFKDVRVSLSIWIQTSLGAKYTKCLKSWGIVIYKCPESRKTIQNSCPKVQSETSWRLAADALQIKLMSSASYVFRNSFHVASIRPIKCHRFREIKIMVVENFGWICLL